MFSVICTCTCTLCFWCTSSHSCKPSEGLIYIVRAYSIHFLNTRSAQCRIRQWTHNNICYKLFRQSVLFGSGIVAWPVTLRYTLIWNYVFYWSWMYIYQILLQGYDKGIKSQWWCLKVSARLPKESVMTNADRSGPCHDCTVYSILSVNAMCEVLRLNLTIS